MKKLTPEVKKLLINFIGFCVFFSIIAFSLEKGIAYFVTLSGDSQTGKVNLIMEHKIDSDVMIFGSSVAEVGFNSNVIESNLNKSVYNLAIDGTPILKSEFLIDEFLSYSEKCDTIMIGLAFFSFSKMQEMNEPGRYLAHKSNKYLKENIRKVAPELHAKLYNVPFYSFIVADHTYYKNAYLGLKNVINKKTFYGNQEKGFSVHDETYYDTRSTDGLKMDIEFSEKVIERFKRVVEKIKSHNITPILIITPMHINGQSFYNNYKEYTNIAKDISEKTNTRLIDFSKSNITKEDKYFYNNGHLNKLGALTFSKNVCDSIATNPQTPQKVYVKQK
ncbi:hypothetical protein [Polaribacter sargassicola]|uniref:hypothetical protein n=1 Tax=Polaribacter sargassicola TaxID=2836891 RepID=UPI001F3219F8|nr:hypothetical protein [Polaribacter sp. DS7-9]MCG1037812.1 hypothetical protein [Polaribacter sp. DS7-9]